jgi:hypothetical protein
MMRFLKADCDLPWACIGDFNEVLRREEQMGPNERDMTQINKFREVVDACQLCDIGYRGLDWTFERRVQGNAYCRVRLDRVLASSEWCNRFPFATVTHLTAVKSDHSPILLLNEMEAGNQRIALAKPFRYEVMWERHDELKPTVAAGWSGDQGGNSVNMVREKIDDLARNLGRWGVDTFGSVRKEIRGLKKELELLRNLPSRVGPSHAEIKITDRLVELYHREEIM